jgi:hypothetical protein
MMGSDFPILKKPDKPEATSLLEKKEFRNG